MHNALLLQHINKSMTTVLLSMTNRSWLRHAYPRISAILKLTRTF